MSPWVAVCRSKMRPGELIDISPPITPETAVWPGDTPFSRAVLLDMHDGHNLTLSSLTSTVHIGAHADAPAHYTKDGATIDGVALEAYLGPCTVVTCKAPKNRQIQPEDAGPALARGAKRILFRTLSQPDYKVFNEDFVSFSPESLERMGLAGVVLVGIDTASVDAFDSKPLPSHQTLVKYGIRNLEGLVLEHVPDGDYELIALPLKLVGFDASPVRAVLRQRTP